MIKVETLAAWHIEQIQPRRIYKDENLERLHSAIGKESVFAAALVEHDLVVAIVGGNVLWNGVVHVWAVTTDHVPRFKKAVHAQVKNLLEAATISHEVHRFEATVRDDYEVGKKWIERLGFVEEATLKKYGPDKTDYILYARTT